MENFETRQSTQGSTFVNLMRDSGFKAVYADKDNKQLLIELLNFFSSGRRKGLGHRSLSRQGTGPGSRKWKKNLSGLSLSR